MAPDEEIGRQIDTLVDKLPRDAADQMLDRIEDEGGEGPRKDAVRQALVRRLNAARRQHARRLFTGLFDPFLSRDPLFLRPDLAPACVLHPLDIGALWSWLSAGPLRGPAAAVEAELGTLSARLPIHRILPTPEAAELARRLADGAAATLSPILESAAETQALLTRLNGWRTAEAGRRADLPKAPRPLGRDDLVLIRALLLAGDPVADLVERAMAILAKPWTAPLAEVLADAAAMAPVPAGARSGQAEIGRMVPLTLVTAHKAHAAWPLLLTATPPAWREMLAGVLARHVARAATALAEGLVPVVAPGGLRVPLSPSAAALEGLERELATLDTLLATAEEYGLLSSDRFGPAIRDPLGRMIRTVEAEVYPALIERCMAAGRATARPTPDQAPVEAMLDYIARWRAALSRSLHWGTGYTEFRDHVLEELRHAIGRSFTQPGYEGPQARLAHAARLGALARRLGAEPEGWLSLLDKGLIPTATARLRDPAPLDPPEAALLRAVAALVGAELKRTRYWKSADLQDYADLAAARLGPDGKAA